MFRHIRRPFLVMAGFAFLGGLIHPIFLLGVPVLILDIRARHIEYLKYRDLEWRFQYAYTLRRSWCARGVAQSIWPDARKFYENLGYRWWHVLPDGFPGCFLRIAFWRSVVGADLRSGAT